MEGVLILPTSFDPTKKYPVLVWVYEQFRYLMSTYMAEQVEATSLIVTYLPLVGTLSSSPTSTG